MLPCSSQTCYIVVTSNNIPKINLLRSCSEETLFSCLKTAEANHFWAHSRPRWPALKAPNLTVTQIGSWSPWGGSELKPSLHSDSPREVIWEGSGQVRGGISVPWRRGQRAFVHSDAAIPATSKHLQLPLLLPNCEDPTEVLFGISLVFPDQAWLLDFKPRMDTHKASQSIFWIKLRKTQPMPAWSRKRHHDHRWDWTLKG